MSRAEKIEAAARAWTDAMDRWRGPPSETEEGWEKCVREADETEAALRSALALPPEADRYAEGREELGCAGHFIASTRCQFRRHTQVGKNYRVSTVGDYYPRDGQRTTIGAGPNAWFETMVFRTTDRQDPGNEGCGCREVADWSEIDGQRYATAGEAQRGHEAMVSKYLGLAAPPSSYGDAP